MSYDKLDLNVLPEGTIVCSCTLRPQDLLRALDATWNRALSLVSAQNFTPTFGKTDDSDDSDDSYTETISAMADLIDQHRKIREEEIRPVLTMYDLIDNESPLASLVNEPELHEYASSLLEDLIEALHAFIPENCYVGMHEGDGSLLGVWRAED